MKTTRFNFYSGIFTVLIVFIIAAAIALIFSSCELLTQAIPPIDHPTEIPQDTTDTLPIDTVDTDTIIPIESDTCAEYIAITDPAFVTMYVKFDNPQSGVIWQGGGHQSSNIADIVPFITSYPFKAFTNENGACVIIEGTNNHQDFLLDIFTEVDDAKWYMGSGMQSFIFPGMSYNEYLQTATDLPSVNMFSFWGHDFDSIQTRTVAREILGDCKAGRWYADFYYSPDMPQEFLDSFDLAGWERIRNMPQGYSIVTNDVADSILRDLAKSGRQICVKKSHKALSFSDKCN